MELKEFVKKVILDLDVALSEANLETQREVKLRGVKEQRNALEFDVAVTVESSASGEVGGGIKVLGLVDMGVEGSTELKNSVVSRVRFGIDVGERTKHEEARLATQFQTHRDRLNSAR